MMNAIPARIRMKIDVARKKLRAIDHRTTKAN
jgi:hypothetical protein